MGYPLPPCFFLKSLESETWGEGSVLVAPRSMTLNDLYARSREQMTCAVRRFEETKRTVPIAGGFGTSPGCGQVVKEHRDRSGRTRSEWNCGRAGVKEVDHVLVW